MEENFKWHAKNLVFGIIALILGGFVALLGLIVNADGLTSIASKYLVIFGIFWCACALVGMIFSSR